MMGRRLAQIGERGDATSLDCLVSGPGGTFVVIRVV
jgi:hypothetical protein